MRYYSIQYLVFYSYCQLFCKRKLYTCIYKKNDVEERQDDKYAAF